MPKPIRPARKRTLTRILASLLPPALRRPGRGRHRAGQTPPPAARRIVVRAVAPPRLPGRLSTQPHPAAAHPGHHPRTSAVARYFRASAAARRPHPSAPVAPSAYHLRVRPYLLAHQQHPHRQQQARRLALAFALDGIDVGPSVIHGHRIGTPVTPTPLEVAA